MTDPHIIRAFQERFGAGPEFLVRAPGRVNLIGDHTDYNDGFVMPLAIDREILLAARPKAKGEATVRSLDFEDEFSFDPDRPDKGGPAWGQYIQGVAWVLKAAGYPLRGWDGVVKGNVPIGAGLSSSAALEVAGVHAFGRSAGFTPEVHEIARLAQRAENEWVGMQCGIMDQMACAGGRSGHAMLLDCRSLAYRAIPLPRATTIMVLDTTTRRGLVDSEYNVRRSTCEKAARIFGVRALRDVSLDLLEEKADLLDEAAFRRARHVILENRRTREAATAMENNDAEHLGRLMHASHDSLRDDFEVSSPALNDMVVCASGLPGCLGARMTGAGFGGCAVAVVRSGEVETFCERLASCFEERTGLTPMIYACTAVNGAEVMAFESYP